MECIMKKLRGKKLLVLGGKPIGSYEIVEYAKSLGIYTIVADYLPDGESRAKQIADETWQISTADVKKLGELAAGHGVDGIYTGVHEFNIERMIELCDMLKYPCFCDKKQWDILNNKRSFKNLCREFDIPVTEEYIIDYNRINADIRFPVVVKPTDGSGSRGFNVCNNTEELKEAYLTAAEFSQSKSVLVEKFMDYKKSIIIHYTIVDGKFYFSGILDKRSSKVFPDGAPIMSVQFYPSRHEEKYVRTLNEKVIKMFRHLGLKNGVIWIEAFIDDDTFVMNEMGYRFGGSLTYFPIKMITGIDQLALQIEYALTGKYEKLPEIISSFKKKSYCILPVHVKPGRICGIEGINELEAKPEIVRIVQVHDIGDSIDSWGTAKQVFAYIHIMAESMEEIEHGIDDALKTVKVYDEQGDNMLFNLYKG